MHAPGGSASHDGSDRVGGGEGPWRAVIDIGSNTALMLIARRRRDGSLEIKEDRARMTRLSAGAARTGRLDPAAIERTLAALREHRAEAEACGAAITAVATEGVRIAGNADRFLRPASELLGVPVRVIPGSEEAALSYRSVALERPDAGSLRVIDIGGASTELVSGAGLEIASAMSHKIGSVRLSETLLAGGGREPQTPAQVAAVRAAARAALATQPLPPWPELYGLAGTVTTAAALLLGLERYARERVDGTRHSFTAVMDLLHRLARMHFDERITLPCLPPGRADVIVAGVAILTAAMEHCGAETLVCRDRGLRYALIDP